MSVAKIQQSNGLDVSSGDSSDESDNERGPQVQEATYLLAQLGEAVQEPENYAAAVEELALWVGQHYQRMAKAAQALVVADAHSAVANYDGRARSKQALARLARAVEKRLPAARRAAFSRKYRQRSVQVQRQGRRGAGGGGRGEGEGEEEAVGVGHLPAEVLASVFRFLDPVSLGAAACVDHSWRRAAEEEALWEALLQGTFATLPRLEPGSLEPGSLEPGSLEPGSLEPGSLEPGGARRRFGCLAAADPVALRRWRTNRSFRKGRLRWEPPLLLPGTRPAHGYLRPADAVSMLYLKSQLPQIARRDATGHESSESDNAPDDAFFSSLRFLTLE